MSLYFDEIFEFMKSVASLKREEIANAITHGVGALLAFAALVLLIVFSALHGSAWHVSSFAIFGSTMVVLYVMSTLYHSLTHIRAKKLFRKFDHMSIFLLIAGTYTPFCLTTLRGWLGWTIFGIVWACAVGGIVLKAFHTGKGALISTILYIIMGWIIIFFIRPVYETMSTEGFSFLLLGGAFYTVGAFFFIREKIPYNHSIWHLFVLAGSIFHFFAVLSLL
jgi:hemolysin III